MMTFGDTNSGNYISAKPFLLDHKAVIDHMLVLGVFFGSWLWLLLLGVGVSPFPFLSFLKFSFGSNIFAFPGSCIISTTNFT